MGGVCGSLAAAGAAKGKVLVGDDRKPDSVWAGGVDQMAQYCVASINADSMWTLRPGLTTDDCKAWQYAQARMGLPAFLRTRMEIKAVGVKASHSFPLIKSKCFDSAGKHMCRAAGHSCWRRVVDSSQGVARMGWRTVARGARAVVRLSGAGQEVWDMRTAAVVLQEHVGMLSIESPCC